MLTNFKLASVYILFFISSFIFISAPTQAYEDTPYYMEAQIGLGKLPIFHKSIPSMQHNLIKGINFGKKINDYSSLELNIMKDHIDLNSFENNPAPMNRNMNTQRNRAHTSFETYDYPSSSTYDRDRGNFGVHPYSETGSEASDDIFDTLHANPEDNAEKPLNLLHINIAHKILLTSFQNDVLQFYGKMGIGASIISLKVVEDNGHVSTGRGVLPSILAEVGVQANIHPNVRVGIAAAYLLPKILVSGSISYHSN